MIEIMIGDVILTSGPLNGDCLWEVMIGTIQHREVRMRITPTDAVYAKCFFGSLRGEKIWISTDKIVRVIKKELLDE